MIGIEQLHYDPTDADSIAASHTVGAYTLAGDDGTAIGHTGDSMNVNVTNSLGIDVDLDHTEDSVQLGDGTTVFTGTTNGADHGLDVNLINTEIAVTQGSDSPWAVEATDLDIRDLTHVSDSIRLGDGTDLTTTTTVASDIGLDVYLLNASIEVTATDLDIRDLNFATDSVTSRLNDGSGNAITSTGGALDVNISNTDISVTQGTSPWVIGDGGGSITVDAVDLDIRDLTHASDSIRLGDGTDLTTTTTVGADVGLDVNVLNNIAVSDVADTAILNTQKDVTVTGALLASQLADRKYLYVQNLGANKMYIGASGVTSANGISMSKGSLAELRLGPALSLHAVSAAGTVDARLMELS